MKALPDENVNKVIERNGIRPELGCSTDQVSIELKRGGELPEKWRRRPRYNESGTNVE
jgi:hypothetical protein